jgi:hypothetical protein
MLQPNTSDDQDDQHVKSLSSRFAHFLPGSQLPVDETIAWRRGQFLPAAMTEGFEPHLPAVRATHHQMINGLNTLRTQRARAMIIQAVPL